MFEFIQIENSGTNEARNHKTAKHFFLKVLQSVFITVLCNLQIQIENQGRKWVRITLVLHSKDLYVKNDI